MFSAYLVFGRRRIRVGDPKATEKNDNISLLEFWIPNGKQGESAEARLESEGLPKPSRLADFCFARKKYIDDAAGLVPPALSFVFTLTSSTGERTHCYCLRAHRPDDIYSHRMDVGGEWIEASLFITKYPFHRLFPAALQICRVRRTLDRSAYENFLSQLHKSFSNVGPLSPSGGSGSSSNKGSLLVDSPSLNVSTKFEFSLSKEPKLECIFDTMNSQVLCYILGAILLERRVCLVGKHEKRLSDVAYALAHLACGEAPLKGYCHNFVPVLPGTMLEHGLGNPAPYIVGILRSFWKATDAIKELGDIVTVDLDSRVVKVTPSGSPVLPLGMELVSESVSGAQGSKSAPDPANPWSDTCSPFQRDLAQAFSTKDTDLLLAAVRSIVLIVTVGRVGSHLDDPALKVFNALFKKTQIAAAAQTANETAIAMILGTKGYPAVRAGLLAQQQASTGPERANINQTSASVIEVTGSGSAKGRPDLVTRNTVEIAKKSFDVTAYYEGLDVALKSRLADCQGRNWKYGYKALGLLNLLVRMGSELVLASCWDDLATIFDLTRFSLNGIMGVPSRVVDLVQKRAKEIYALVVDIHVLTFVRGFTGHIMFQRATRQKMQASVARIPLGKDLKTLLDVCAPAPIVENDPDEENNNGRPTSLVSGIGKPPPPPPVSNKGPAFSKIPQSSSNQEGLLIDMDIVDPGASSLTPPSILSPAMEDHFAFPKTPIQVQGKSVPPPPPPPPHSPATLPPNSSLGERSPVQGRAVAKLLTAFEPKLPPARADNKLITAFDNGPPTEGKSDRPRRPRTLESAPPSDDYGSDQVPARPQRAAGQSLDVAKMAQAFEALETASAPPTRPARAAPTIAGLATEPKSQDTKQPVSPSLSPPFKSSAISASNGNGGKTAPPGMSKKSPTDVRKPQAEAPTSRPRPPPPPAGPLSSDIK